MDVARTVLVAGTLLAVLAEMAPPLHAGESAAPTTSDYHVSARTGDDNHPGTADRPWKTITQAAASVEPGSTVLVAPGVYRAEKFGFKPAGQDFDHPTVFKFTRSANSKGRAVLTGPDGKTPSFTLQPYVRLEGLWIGGRSPESQKQGASGAINRPGVQVVGCVFWGGYFQLLCGNTARNILFRDNLLVHMGGDWLHHPIYISGGPPPTSQDCRFIGNVFVNGGGFALHCYHKPKNVTMVGNFTTGHMASMVAQGPGHVIHHNVFWKPRGKPGRPDWNWNALLPNDVLRFDHNLLGSDHPIREGGKPKAPPVHNYSLAGIRGTQVDLIPIKRGHRGPLPFIGATERQVDAAVAWLDAYFLKRSPEEISEDTSDKVRRCLRVLRVKYEPTQRDLGSRPLEQ